MDNLYFYVRDRQRVGPFPLEKLKEENITPATLVWCRGMASWVKAGELPEFADFFAVVEEPQLPEVAEPEPVEPEDDTESEEPEDDSDLSDEEDDDEYGDEDGDERSEEHTSELQSR